MYNNVCSQISILCGTLYDIIYILIKLVLVNGIFLSIAIVYALDQLFLNL